MSPTMNKLRVEVTANSLGKMQYFPLYDRIDIALDQCHYNNKLIPRSLITHSNIYRASSALLLSFFKFKASPEGLEIKKTREGVRCGVCAIPMDNAFSGE